MLISAYIERSPRSEPETLSKVMFIDHYPEGLCTGEALPDGLKEHAKVVQLADLLGELSAYRTLAIDSSF